MGVRGRLGCVLIACLIELAVLVVLPVATAAPIEGAAPLIASTHETPKLPFSEAERYFDPGLEGTTDRANVVVTMDASAPVSDVARHLKGARVAPVIGGARIVFGAADSEGIGTLRSLDSVYALVENRPTPLRMHNKPGLDRIHDTPLGPLTLAEPVAIDEIFDRSPLTGAPEVTMRDVVNFTGARRAWEELGVDGDGITIAVVDTGVDFGAFDLGESAVHRMGPRSNRWPSSFDPDGTTFAYTTIEVDRYTLAGVDNVTTGGTNPLIYVFDIFGFFPGGFGPKAFRFSDLFRTPFPADMDVTGLPQSQGGTYRFGILWQWNFGIDLFPILLVDANAPGVFDTIYLDLSFDWAIQGFGPGPEFSFADEPALVPAGGNVIAARDMDGDGYHDISAGIPAHVLDIWGFHPRASDAYTVIPPIDPAGDVVGFVYDWAGHGTSVASSAAGRQTDHPVAGPGIAPAASIMGVPALTWGNVIEAWLWSAGFDLVGTAEPSFTDNYGFTYGEWRYTGNHRADIISNSWGVSDWVSWRFGVPWPWYDVLTVVEDVLMIPGYADPAYPGALMVHAGGNGASGYGTMTDPGYNTLALTVGASTSLDFTGLPTAGFHNDIISWSARGPTAIGMLKPDVVQVGAFAWTSAPVWAGGRNGVDSYTLFGGTSQATPVASGSAAVTMQAYEAATGARADPSTIKAILKSTAIDLGYDAFLQGAGHVNVYNAASLALGQSGILVTSPATWDNARQILTAPYAAASVHYGREVGIAPPAAPIGDTSWYAGAVRAGGTTTAEFTIQSPVPRAGTVSAVWHQRVSTVDLSGTTRLLGEGWLEGYGEVLTMSASDIPQGADLMVVRSAMPYDFLDWNGDYAWDNRSRIIVADWVDGDMDGIVDIAELSTFNYGYNTGTTSEARVGLPSGRFEGSIALWFSQAFDLTTAFTPMPFVVTVEFYDRVPWEWVSITAAFETSPGSPAVLAAELTVPEGAAPSVYQGQIFVIPEDGGATAVPVSVVVPRVIDDATLWAPLTIGDSPHIYDPSQVNGMFDWRWRYEAGDWKLWFVEVEDPSTIALQVRAQWSGARTDIDIASFGPNGVFGDSTVSPSLGSGRFRWSTRTGTTEDWVSVSTSSGLEETALGLYGFAIHNVLFEGSATSEGVTGTVGAVKLNPRGPITIPTRPGATVTVPFTLSTGFDLSAVTFETAGPTKFLLDAEPAFTEAVAQGETLSLLTTITVPVGTPDGVYIHHVRVAAAEFVPTFVLINIVVDSSGPAVTILSPFPGAYVSGTVLVSASVSEENGIASVWLGSGTFSSPMVQEPISGLWFGAWVGLGTPDGPVDITVTATDFVGNEGRTSVNVVLDNTAPTVAFSYPEHGSWVRGTVTLAFAATDANLLAAFIVYGETFTDVLGSTSLDVDTTALRDGEWTFSLFATDAVGNAVSSTLTLNVDNTAPVAQLLSPAANAHIRSTVGFSFVVQDANVRTATLTLGGGIPIDVSGQTARSLDTTLLADGSKTAVLRVTDLAGNEATDSRELTIDNTAPEAAFGPASPFPRSWVRGDVTLVFIANDLNLHASTLVFGDTSRNVQARTSEIVDTTTLGDGEWTFSLIVTDQAGNVGIATLPLKVDNTAPIAELLSPAANAHLRGSVPFNFAIHEANVATATLTIGTGDPLDVRGQSSRNVVTNSITDGVQVVRLAVIDLAGNAVVDTQSVTIDNTAPAVSIQTPADEAALRGMTTISFTATDPNMEVVELLIDGRSVVVTGTASSWNTNDAGDGKHVIEVRARDRAGNVGTDTVTVSTDNVAQARQQSLNSGLLNGVVIALIVGFLIGLLIGRRRKPADQTAPPEARTPSSEKSDTAEPEEIQSER